MSAYLIPAESGFALMLIYGGIQLFVPSLASLWNYLVMLSNAPYLMYALTCPYTSVLIHHFNLLYIHLYLLSNICSWVYFLVCFFVPLSTHLSSSSFICYDLFFYSLDVCWFSLSPVNIHLEQKTECKFLGVRVDDDITWKSHTNYISSIITKS